MPFLNEHRVQNMPYLNIPLLFHSPEFGYNQEFDPQYESCVMAPGCCQTAVSASEYFSFMSSPCEHSFAHGCGKEYAKVGWELGQESQLSYSAQCLLVSLSPQKQGRASGLAVKVLQRDKQGQGKAPQNTFLT